MVGLSNRFAKMLITREECGRYNTEAEFAKGGHWSSQK